MKLGFEESQAVYDSGSQWARVWTEGWVAREMFCANCGSPTLTQLPNNSPVADLAVDGIVVGSRLRKVVVSYRTMRLRAQWVSPSWFDSSPMRALEDVVWGTREMAWFLNHYHCDDCGADWEDEWSCCVTTNARNGLGGIGRHALRRLPTIRIRIDLGQATRYI